jgi:hypothetical protein
VSVQNTVFPNFPGAYLQSSFCKFFIEKRPKFIVENQKPFVHLSSFPRGGAINGFLRFSSSLYLKFLLGNPLVTRASFSARDLKQIEEEKLHIANYRDFTSVRRSEVSEHSYNSKPN